MPKHEAHAKHVEDMEMTLSDLVNNVLLLTRYLEGADQLAGRKYQFAHTRASAQALSAAIKAKEEFAEQKRQLDFLERLAQREGWSAIKHNLPEKETAKEAKEPVRKPIVRKAPSNPDELLPSARFIGGSFKASPFDIATKVAVGK